MIESQDELDELARLNLLAGLKAIASSAYVSARRFLSFGIKVLGSQGWTRCYSLCFELSRHRANCAFLSGDTKSAMSLFEACHKQTDKTFDKGLVFEMIRMESRGPLPWMTKFFVSSLEMK